MTRRSRKRRPREVDNVSTRLAAIFEAAGRPRRKPSLKVVEPIVDPPIEGSRASGSGVKRGSGTGEPTG